MTVLGILRDKFLRLGRDDDGVALVTTLAVFMFIYLVCMGVYAIGTAVKTRIHLQNACDSAAYSAAVVQADTLSRIATINRAMSWTYVQMTRRQMDYIVWKWLKHAVCHYDIDRKTAKEWYESGTRCSLHSWWKLWPSSENEPGSNGDSGGKITLNDGLVTVYRDKVESTANSFPGKMSDYASSFYATGGDWTIDRLSSQIQGDKQAISNMNTAVSTLLEDLANKIDTVARNMLQVNMPLEIGSGWTCKVIQSSDPLSATDGYVTHLTNCDSDERRFLSFHDDRFLENRTVYDEFGKGINKWFVYGNGSKATKSEPAAPVLDIQRSYRHWERGVLMAKWKWTAAYSTCVEGEHRDPIIRTNSCWHAHTNDDCGDGCRTHSAVCYGDNEGEGEPKVWEDLSHVGEKAQPLVLTGDYFGKNGTITVAVAATNANPWSSVLGRIAGGIFSAFNPFTGYTVCIASAKAGYKYLGEDYDNNTRAYRVDWCNPSNNWALKEQSWNLCQSDWDAVLIPVRKAESFAGRASVYKDAAWSDGVAEGLLQRYIGDANGLNIAANSMLAGGNGIDVSTFYAGRDLGEEYRFGNQAGFWGGAQLQTSQDNTGSVNAQWQIGSPNAAINWNGLERVMLH